MRKMQLKGLYHIRTKKRVSRKKLAEDLNLSVEYIKALETTDTELVGNKLIQMFADYFKCTPYEILNNNEAEDLLEKKMTVEKIEIPNGVDINDANQLLFDLLKKYSPIDYKNINQLISEFKYRIEELPRNDSFRRLMESEFNIDEDEEDDYDENDYGDPIELIPEVIMKIRKDAATAATFYKELRAQGLDPTEAIMIIKALMN